MRHCIVSGAYESAIWTAGPDSALDFRNNVVTGCEMVWVKNPQNPATYRAVNCHFSGNRHMLAEYDREAGAPKPTEKMYLEGGVPRQDSLVQLVRKADVETPRDYLHVVPGTPGSELGAGLFRAPRPQARH
jgi:hypothetical protein